MVGSHKILTVSYGTFSCTLEGFEDSFDTMKAIAEYFRDLAADDRYFGAEPPQPDAEMLARIAEREVSRRVEARMESSGIVLRMGQSLDGGHPAAAAPVAAAPVAAAPAPVQAMPPVAQPLPVAETQAPVTPPPAAESVAAKLQRIRAVVGKGAAAPVVAEVEEAVEAPEPSGALAALVAEANRVAVEPVATVDLLSGFEDFAASDMDAEMAFEEAVEPLAEEMAATEVDEDVAVVVEDVYGDVAAYDEPAVDDMFDDEGFDEETPVAEVEPEPVVSEVEVTVEEIAEAEPDLSAAQEMPVAPQPIRARVIRMRKSDFDRAVAAGALVAAEAVEDQPEVGADLAADLAEADERDLVDPDDLADLADLSDLDDLARLDAVAAPLSEDDEAELLAELAAVEREAMTEVELDLPLEDADDELGAELAAIAAGVDDVALDGLDDESAEDGVMDPAMATDEDDPMADVLRAMQDDAPAMEQYFDDLEDDVEVEAEAVAIAEVAEDDAVEDEVAEPVAVADVDMETETETEAEPARSRFVAPDEDEAALSRLLSQTDAQMSGPDAARRREAIAQLRAAVAATEAARALGEPAAAEAVETEDDFREDLRHAVRPRRPVTGQHDLRSERPRPAPLKLVASQRIDLPDDVRAAPLAPAMQPIRPRRVTVEQVAAAREVAAEERIGRDASAAAAASDSFADFAESMGAVSLADMLEAAAAYTAFVEGTGDFSRPQILRRVSQIQPDASREDGMRLFGTLLREGRIRRSERAGRFEVAEDTRFNPDRRAV